VGLTYADGSLPVGLGAGEASLGRAGRRVRNECTGELKHANGSAAVGLGGREASFERKGRSCLELSPEEHSMKTVGSIAQLGAGEASFGRKGRSCLELSSEEDSSIKAARSQTRSGRGKLSARSGIHPVLGGVRNDCTGDLKYANGSAAVGPGAREASFERKGRSCMELSSEEDASIKTDWRRSCNSSRFLYS
jgi:hypothetical protein